VYFFRALETPQIETLCFTANPENQYATTKACQRRLMQLHQAGYLWRGEQASKLLSEGRKPYVYRLDQRGAELLPSLLKVEPEQIKWRPDENEVSDLFLNHLLRTNDVRIAITLASNDHGLLIHRWLDDKTLKSDLAKDYVMLTNTNGSKQQVAVIPDGYFHLIRPRPDERDLHYHFFIEADLGNVTVQTSDSRRRSWARKVSGFIAYHSSGKFTRRYQAKRFRVLTITTTPQRLAYLKTITEQQKGRHIFWLTTFDEVKPETILTKPIWQIAAKKGYHSLIDLPETK
jgi:hypothetical protein